MQKESGSILVTSSMLHTIRNNLNAIIGYAQILQDGDAELDEQQKMQTSIEKAALNINSLLSLKKETPKSNPHANLENEATDTSPIHNTNQKILIVDDKPENLSLFSDILRPYHYELSVATSGAIALELLKSFHPDLILLDVIMPEMNGYEVLREIKKDKLTSDIPVIFLTAKDTTEDIVKGFEEGAVDYIAKPFHPKELIARVHTHLQKAKLFAKLKKLMEHSFHELYTPLSVISSAMEIQELEHQQTNYTQMTLAACKTLQSIYDDLYFSLNYSSTPREKKAFDFVALLKQRIHYFSLVAKSRSLEFKTEMPNQLSLVQSPENMERVIDNLISNALKYTKESSIITLSLTKNGDRWLFDICNPITKEIDVEKIFQKYYRAKEEVFGLGLGLELVQSICNENSIPLRATANDGLFCIQMELVEKK